MSYFPTENLIKSYKLFWQYPVITEKTFYEQNKHDEKYIGFPWATIIDKRYNENVIYKIIQPNINNNLYFTCVQHISFRKIIPLLKALNIKCLYTPHKIIGEDIISGITIKPCPLYAVNIEDINRNLVFKNKNYITINRHLLYSFQGAYDKRWYLSDIREKIFTMNHPENCFINHIGGWHFDKVVYSNIQNNEYKLNEDDNDHERTNKYNKLLLDSRYSLCPSGSGPNSIRFWESLATGTIPILLADTLELPENELWKDAIVRINENNINNLTKILENISISQEKIMRKNCIKLYNYYRDNYKNNLKLTIDDNKKTIFTSYLCDIKDDIVQNILKQWKILNPNLNVLYFSDNDVDNFFATTEYYETYKKMRNGVAIADFFRICYINKNGGYWFDIDINPIKLSLPLTGNIHLFDCGYGNISYMFIGGKSNQKLWKDVINNVIINIENNIPNKVQHVMEITGPRIIQNLIFNKMNIHNKDGCLKCTNNYEKYLLDTDYEFIYSRLLLTNTKINEYKTLQNKYKKKNYQQYNYI